MTDKSKDVELQVFDMKKVLAGEVDIGSTRGNSNVFPKIREKAMAVLRFKETGMTLWSLAKWVETEFALNSPQQAYNYATNALRRDRRFVITTYKKNKDDKTERGRKFVVRVDGPKKPQPKKVKST